MKSPFLVFEEFLSPLQCEEIILGNNNVYPNIDKYGKVQPLFSGNRLAENRLLPQIVSEVLPSIESHYNVNVRGVKSFRVEWYAAGYEGKNKPICENSIYMDGKWSRSNDNDFAGIIFLNDYNDQVPFDDDYEVFGGQLEFPTHEFSFNPQRGALIVYPGAPNFINNTAAVKAGELTQLRFHVACEKLYVYNKDEFKGNYKIWFGGNNK